MAALRRRSVEHALQHARPDQHRQREQPESRLDAFAGQPGVAGVHAAGRRRHDVRDHLDRPEVRLRARRQDRQDRSGSTSRRCPTTTSRRCAAAWTTAVSRTPTAKCSSAVWMRKLVALDANTGKELWVATVAGLQEGPRDHLAAGGLQEPGRDRHRRRRVRHSRLRAGVRSDHRQVGLEDLHDSRHRASPATIRGRAIRGRPAPARPGTSAPTMPSATWSTGAPATAAHGAGRRAATTRAIYGRTPTCGPRRSSRSMATPARSCGAIR